MLDGGTRFAGADLDMRPAAPQLREGDVLSTLRVLRARPVPHGRGGGTGLAVPRRFAVTRSDLEPLSERILDLQHQFNNV